TYVIARRQDEHPGAPGRFVSIIEPFKGQPLIKAVRSIDVQGAGTAIEVERSDCGKDVIIYDIAASQKSLLDGAVSTDAHVAVVRRDVSGQPSGRFFVGGSFLNVNGRRTEAARRAGQVVSLDPAKSEIRVKPDQHAEAREFVGRVVHF